MSNKTKIVIISITIIFVAFVLLFFTLNRNNGKYLVDVVVIPKDAKITLDKNQTIGNGENYITAGKHSISATRQGFESDSQIFIVDKTNDNKAWLVLNSNSDVGKEYIKSHQEEFTGMEKLADERYEADSQKLLDKYPIINNLPKDMLPLYRIDYGASIKYPGDQTKIALIISYDNPTDKSAAIKSIYEMGYDPSDYEIIFKGIE